MCWIGNLSPSIQFCSTETKQIPWLWVSPGFAHWIKQLSWGTTFLSHVNHEWITQEKNQFAKFNSNLSKSSFAESCISWKLSFTLTNAGIIAKVGSLNLTVTQTHSWYPSEAGDLFYPNCIDNCLPQLKLHVPSFAFQKKILYCVHKSTPLARQNFQV